MDRIRIGIAHWGAGIAPVFAGVEGGYFAAHGLDGEPIFVEPVAAIERDGFSARVMGAAALNGARS